jgi:hypothetical protein
MGLQEKKNTDTASTVYKQYKQRSLRNINWLQATGQGFTCAITPSETIQNVPNALSFL